MRGRIVFIPLFFGLLTAPPSAHGFLDVIDRWQSELQGKAEDPASGLRELLEELDATTVATFVDVPSDAWYAPSVAAMAAWKIVDGYRDAAGRRTGFFGPGDPVTIAQMTKMALRSAKVDETACAGTVRHSRAKGHWAEAFILCAENRDFRIFGAAHAADPDRIARRGEVLGIIHDAFGVMLPPLTSSFPDNAGHPYERDIAYAMLRGVVSGDSDVPGAQFGRFRPEDPVTRAEAAKMLTEHIKSIIFNAETEEAVVLDITARNHAFSPNTLTVRKGQLVTLRFHNAGRHTFTLPALEISKLLGNETEAFSFVPSQVGAFPFYCAVQGHQEKGMVGTLIVK